MHNGIRKLIRKRKRPHARAKRHNTPETWYTFKQIRNQCIALIKSSKLQYKNKITQMLHSNNFLTSKI